MADPILPIIQLIRQGERQAARAQLVALARSKPNDERVWFLLSLVVDDPQQQSDCLRRVLQINPDNQDAERRLIALGGAPSPEPEAPTPEAWGAPPPEEPEAIPWEPLPAEPEPAPWEAPAPAATQPAAWETPDEAAAQPPAPAEAEARPWERAAEPSLWDASAGAEAEPPADALAVEEGDEKPTSGELTPAPWETVTSLRGSFEWPEPSEAEAEEEEPEDAWPGVPRARLDFGAGRPSDVETTDEEVDEGGATPPAAAFVGDELPAPGAGEAEGGEDLGEAVTEADATVSALRRRERSRKPPPVEAGRRKSGRPLRLVLLSLVTFGLLGLAVAFAAVQLGFVRVPAALEGLLPLGAARGESLAATEGAFSTPTSPPEATATSAAVLFPTLPPEWTPTAVVSPTPSPALTSTPLPTPTVAPDEALPAGLPGGQLVFVRHSQAETLDVPATVSNLFVMDAPGGGSFAPGSNEEGAAPLTFSGDGQNLSPSGSPDGQFIAWAATVGETTDILTVPVLIAQFDPQAEVKNLTSDSSNDTGPVWSPDGKQIAFASDRLGSFHIFVMEADGSNLRQLTAGVSNNLEPGWSPDGSEIVFASDRNENWDVFVTSVDGEFFEQLTLDPADDRQPTFSPSGDKIAFVSTRDENQDIYVMGSDGREPINVTFDPAVDTDPAWGPAGEWIVFSSERDGNFELYTLSLAQVEPLRLTNTPSFAERMPYWKPLARPSFY